MSNLEKMMSSSNPSLMGFVGAAIIGLVFQGFVYLLFNNHLTLLFFAIILYSFLIMISGTICRKKDCKILCQLNEFWFTLDAIIKNTIASIKI